MRKALSDGQEWRIRSTFIALAHKHGKTGAYRVLAEEFGVSFMTIKRTVPDLAKTIPGISRSERGRMGGIAKKGKTKATTPVMAAPQEPSGGNCEDVVIAAAGMLIKNYDRMVLELAEKTQKLAELEQLYAGLKGESVKQHTKIVEQQATIETLNRRIIELQDVPKHSGTFRVADSLGEESRRNIERLMTEAKSVVGV